MEHEWNTNGAAIENMLVFTTVVGNVRSRVHARVRDHGYERS
jgi:hypothetical protein